MKPGPRVPLALLALAAGHLACGSAPPGRVDGGGMSCEGGACTVADADIPSVSRPAQNDAALETASDGLLPTSDAPVIPDARLLDDAAPDAMTSPLDGSPLAADTAVPDTCSAGLRQSLTDGWGIKWDGLERAADTHAAAEMACAAFGGRLPTATELYRVSANQSATVGQTTHINYLWSASPRGPGQRVIVRLSDATTDLAEVATPARNYRCICPGSAPRAFTGGACNGPPQAPCFAVGKRYNMDLQDRAPIPKASALWECAQARGHLADSLAYIEAIGQGLPNGTSRWLHTGDEASNADGIVLRWQNTLPTWTAAGDVGVALQSESRPFRCVGLNYEPGPHPGAIANQFIGPSQERKGETVDTPAAGWAAAHDACFTRGGHLPRASELGELVMQGLPGGSATALWSSDQVGFNGTQFLAATIEWMGVAPTFRYFFRAGAGDGTGWAYKNLVGGRPFRCLYYPIDRQYLPPDTSACMGGCFKAAAAGSPAAMWIDQADRPASTLEGAITICRSLGGHLTSPRDLTEAIRAGLPGGSGARLLTWDLGAGDTNAPRMHVTEWMGADTGFTDQYPKYMTWLPPGSTGPFRCMWTNELR